MSFYQDAYVAQLQQDKESLLAVLKGLLAAVELNERQHLGTFLIYARNTIAMVDGVSYAQPREGTLTAVVKLAKLEAG